ncbi:hypothetical protein BpHYR1_052719 [Brachionus plicatilis]|uniref:Uncharacterized protein n=1 Tax=Brachionus plicatilis TaxID=10195 RepID=A0A3M7SK19_BRAPC|nr:hypothetical protein BpHYR1_052719 [Brachionus plicatilis]
MLRLLNYKNLITPQFLNLFLTLSVLILTQSTSLCLFPTRTIRYQGISIKKSFFYPSSKCSTLRTRSNNSRWSHTSSKLLINKSDKTSTKSHIQGAVEFVAFPYLLSRKLDQTHFWPNKQNTSTPLNQNQ